MSSDSGPLVSIVIPIYNEEAILERALNELLREWRMLPLRFEIILAENGSQDRTVAITPPPPRNVASQSNAGPTPRKSTTIPRAETSAALSAASTPRARARVLSNEQ